MYAVYALEACGSFVGFQSAESVPDKSGACWGDRGRRYSVKHCVADVRKPSPPATTPYQAPSCFFKEHAAPWEAPSEFYSGGEVHYDYISGKSGYIKGNQKKAERFLEDRRGPENEKIVRDYKFRTSVGWPGPKDTLDFVIKELDEVGVQLMDGQLQELLDRLMDFANHSHLWCNRGWTPDELHKQTVRQGPPLISLGPGIQKAIADGELDFEELRRELAKMGIRIIDSN